MTKRKKFSPSKKAAILKQHLQKKKAISELCVEHSCQPSNVYKWQEILFSKAHQVFENSAPVGRPRDLIAQDKKMKHLEEKLALKNEVISELMEELLKEKKQNGVI